MIIDYYQNYIGMKYFYCAVGGVTLIRFKFEKKDAKLYCKLSKLLKLHSSLYEDTTSEHLKDMLV